MIVWGLYYERIKFLIVFEYDCITNLWKTNNVIMIVLRCYEVLIKMLLRMYFDFSMILLWF